MTAEATISRTQIIVIDNVGENPYKDLTFTDKEGKQYKISNKRRQFFDKTIIPNVAVELSYAEAYGKEYIYSAAQVKDKFPPPQTSHPLPNTPQSVTEASKTAEGTLPPPKPKIDSREESIERQSAAKNVLALLALGVIKQDDPLVLAVYNYCADRLNAWQS